MHILHSPYLSSSLRGNLDAFWLPYNHLPPDDIPFLLPCFFLSIYLRVTTYTLSCIYLFYYRLPACVDWMSALSGKGCFPGLTVAVLFQELCLCCVNSHSWGPLSICWTNNDSPYLVSVPKRHHFNISTSIAIFCQPNTLKSKHLLSDYSTQS
jgi:hypothetical protein